MAARRLEVQISADARQFYRTVSRVGDYVWRYGKAIAAMGAAGFTAWAYAVKKAADFGDAIGKAAKRTGASTDALQGLRYAALLSGSSLEEVEVAMKGMSKVVLNAERGLTEGTRVLQELGISLADIQGKPVAEQFDMVMEALAGLESPTKRAALAQEAFGRSGMKMLPMIAGGVDAYRALRTEAARKNILMSPEQIAAAERFNDKLTEVKETMGAALRVGAAESFAPLVAAFERLMEPEVIEGVTQAMQKVSGALVPMVDGFAKLATSKDTMAVLKEGVDSLTLALEIGLKAVEAYAWYWSQITGASKAAGAFLGERAFKANEQLAGMPASAEELEAFRAMIEEQKLMRQVLEAKMPQAAGGNI
jgi:hypothetical protein